MLRRLQRSTGSEKKANSGLGVSKKGSSDAHLHFSDLLYRFRNTSLEKWLVIELKEDCDMLENAEIIKKSILNTFGDDAIFFIPVYTERVSGKTTGMVLFPGYVFVKCSNKVTPEVLLDKENVFDHYLQKRKGVGYVTNKDINDFKQKILKKVYSMVPKKGDKVIVKEGTFKNMGGQIIAVNRRKRTVLVEFIKKTRIVRSPLSIINIEVKNEE